jgi:hypothetical protein
LFRKFNVFSLIISILVIAASGCTGARIAAEMEITNIPDAIDIFNGPTGNINGHNYLCVVVGILEKRYETGILIFDIQNPTKPKQIAYISSPDGDIISGLLLENNIFFITHSNYLELLDISIPASPKETGRIENIDAQSMIISGHNAYINDQGNIVVADISSPAAPVIVNTWQAGENPTKMIAEGDNLILLASKAVHIVDISTPTSLIEVGDIPNPGYSPRIWVPGYFSDIALSGKYLFIAAQEYGMHVFSLTNPVNPVEIAEYKWQKESSGSMLIKGNLVYLLGNKSVLVIDISNPGNPQISGSVDLPYRKNYPTYRYHSFSEADYYLYIPTMIDDKNNLRKLAIEIIDVTAFRAK